MPLIDFYTSTKQSVLEMGIKQIVAMVGDGNLKDSSTASAELRTFLSTVITVRLSNQL